MPRISKDLMLSASAGTMFAYVLHWLTQHRFVEEPHHYVTALVIVLWLASVPVLFLNRFSQERKKYHGYF